MHRHQGQSGLQTQCGVFDGQNILPGKACPLRNRDSTWVEGIVAAAVFLCLLALTQYCYSVPAAVVKEKVFTLRDVSIIEGDAAAMDMS